MMHAVCWAALIFTCSKASFTGAGAALRAMLAAEEILHVEMTAKKL
jgi:hypothetical protein